MKCKYGWVSDTVNLDSLLGVKRLNFTAIKLTFNGRNKKNMPEKF